MARWRPTTPTNCLGAETTRFIGGYPADGCKYFRWKQFSPNDRKAYEALQMLGYEGTWQWNRRRAPYCLFHKEFHHKITGTWTRGEYPFLQETWHIGCVKGIRRYQKANNLPSEPSKVR